MNKKYITIIALMLCSIAFSQHNDSIFISAIHQQQLKDSSSTQKFDYHFYMAERAKNHFELDSAIIELQKCVELDSTNADVWFEISQIHSIRSEYDIAFRALKKAVSYNSNNRYYKEVLGSYYTSLKEYDKAIRIFEELSKKQRQKTDYLYSLIGLYDATNRDKQYFNTLKRLETINGISEETTMAKVGYYQYKKKVKKALAEIDILVDKFPSNKYYKTLKGQYYFSIGDTVNALKSLNEVLHEQPNNGYVDMAFFNYYKKQKNDSATKFHIQKIIDDTDIDITEKMSAISEYITILTNKNQNDIVVDFFDTLISKFPKESLIYSLFGNYLFVSDKKSLAEDKFQTAISLDPQNEDSWNMLAHIYILDNNVEQLLGITNEAERLFPKNVNWAYYKIMALLQQNKKKEAISHIDLYMKKIDDRENRFKSLIMTVKGDVLMEDKLYLKAFECYEKAIDFDPNNIATLNNYAYFLSECDTDFTKAENMSSKTIQAEPQNATYLDTYAWILFKQGDLRGAKFYIERAIQYSNSPDILEHYGDILFHLGDKDNALTQWRKAKENGCVSENITQKITEQRYIPKKLICQ